MTASGARSRYRGVRVWATAAIPDVAKGFPFATAAIGGVSGRSQTARTETLIRAIRGTDSSRSFSKAFPFLHLRVSIPGKSNWERILGKRNLLTAAAREARQHSRCGFLIGKGYPNCRNTRRPMIVKPTAKVRSTANSAAGIWRISKRASAGINAPGPDTRAASMSTSSRTGSGRM